LDGAAVDATAVGETLVKEGEGEELVRACQTTNRVARRAVTPTIHGQRRRADGSSAAASGGALMGGFDSSSSTSWGFEAGVGVTRGSSEEVAGTKMGT
jgi:hypothetical protein